MRRDEEPLELEAAELYTVVQVGSREMKSIGTRLFPHWLNVIIKVSESYDTGQDQLEVF